MYLLLRILQNIHGYLQLGDSDRGTKARTCENDVEPLSIRYNIVSFIDLKKMYRVPKPVEPFHPIFFAQTWSVQPVGLHQRPSSHCSVWGGWAEWPRAYSLFLRHWPHPSRGWIPAVQATSPGYQARAHQLQIQRLHHGKLVAMQYQSKLDARITQIIDFRSVVETWRW